MLSGNKIRFARNVLYRLKRDYGLPADFYHQESETFDLTTGRQTPNTIKLSVRRAVLLPKTASSSDMHSMTEVGSGGQFRFGGEIGTVIRELLVDMKDLKGFTFDDYVNTYVIIESTRYEISEYTTLHGVFYYLKLKATPGAQLAQQLEIDVDQPINVDQTQGETT